MTIRMDEDELCQVISAIVGGVIVLIGYLTFFIFACMSLTKTNTDEVISACGGDLHEIVMVDVIFGSLGLLFLLLTICFIFCCISWCTQQPIDPNSKTISKILENVSLLYGTVLLILGALSSSRYVEAKNKTGCFDVLSSTYNGMRSPSANLGDPLLANIALTYGIMYITSGFSSTLRLIYNVLKLCFN